MRKTKTSGKSVLAQILLGLGLLGLLAFFIHNTAQNLAARGIASGFAFLSRPAGFDISFSLLPFGPDSTFLDAFWVGVSNTLLLSVLSMIFASLLGLFLALGRLASNPLVRILSTVYVETLRNIPLLLQLFFWYFVVLRELPAARSSWEIFGSYINNRGLFVPFPKDTAIAWYLFLALLFGLVLGHLLRVMGSRLRQERGGYPRWWPLAFMLPLLCPLVLGVLLGPRAELSRPQLEGFNFAGGLQIVPELVAMIFALSLYTAAFIGEIIRAGLQSVARGQREAAAALGLSASDSLFLVVLPQAMRVIIPPLISQYLNLCKNSSLAAAIAFPDLVLIFAGTALNTSGQAVEIMAMTMLVYLLISVILAGVLNLYQQRLLRFER